MYETAYSNHCNHAFVVSSSCLRFRRRKKDEEKQPSLGQQGGVGWLEDFFEGDEKLTCFGEGLDYLHLLVKIVADTELLTDAVEGVAAVAGEVVDVAQEGYVGGGVVAGALVVLVGAYGGELGFPEAQERGFDIEHARHFANGVIEFLVHGERGLNC